MYLMELTDLSGFAMNVWIRKGLEYINEKLYLTIGNGDIRTLKIKCLIFFVNYF